MFFNWNECYKLEQNACRCHLILSSRFMFHTLTSRNRCQLNCCRIFFQKPLYLKRNRYVLASALLIAGIIKTLYGFANTGICMHYVLLRFLPTINNKSNNKIFCTIVAVVLIFCLIEYFMLSFTYLLQFYWNLILCVLSDFLCTNSSVIAF